MTAKAAQRACRDARKHTGSQFQSFIGQTPLLAKNIIQCVQRAGLEMGKLDPGKPIRPFGQEGPGTSDKLVRRHNGRPGGGPPWIEQFGWAGTLPDFGANSFPGDGPFIPGNTGAGLISPFWGWGEWSVKTGKNGFKERVGHLNPFYKGHWPKEVGKRSTISGVRHWAKGKTRRKTEGRLGHYPGLFAGKKRAQRGFPLGKETLGAF